MRALSLAKDTPVRIERTGIAIAKLQRKEGAGWRDLDLKEHESEKCLVEGED